ncbi:MAG: hypothetical protein ABWX83_12770 [Luteibacter sp.]
MSGDGELRERLIGLLIIAIFLPVARRVVESFSVRLYEDRIEQLRIFLAGRVFVRLRLEWRLVETIEVSGRTCFLAGGGVEVRVDFSVFWRPVLVGEYIDAQMPPEVITGSRTTRR